METINASVWPGGTNILDNLLMGNFKSEKKYRYIYIYSEYILLILLHLSYLPDFDENSSFCVTVVKNHRELPNLG